MDERSLAELYSTIDEVGGKIRIGNTIDSHWVLLNNQSIALSRVLEADHDSPEYRQKKHMGMFYSTSWALTHMLQLEDDLRPKFAKFSDLIFKGTPTAEAIQTTYGMTVEQMEKHLQAYVRGSTVKVLLFNLKFDKSKLKLNPVPATALESGMALANLEMGSRDCDAAKTMAEALAKEFPESPEPHETIGFCAWGWGDKDRDKAGQAFLAAARKGSHVSNVYSNAVWMLPPEQRAAEAVPLLQKAITLDPLATDPRMQLAAEYLYQKQYELSYQEMRRFKSIRPDMVDRYFPLFVQSAWWAEHLPEARNAAAQYERLATTPDTKSRAASLAKFAAYEPRSPQVAAAIRMMPPPMAPRQDVLPPAELDGEPLDREGKIRLARSNVAVGKFMEMVCLGKQSKIVMDVDGERQEFLMLDPSSVMIGGQGAETIEMNCGAQKGEKLRLVFQQDPERAQGTLGIVRKLEF